MIMRHFYLLLLVSIGLTGCTSYSPRYIALNPQVPIINVQTAEHTSISMSTTDIRPFQYIVRFIDDGNVTRQISASEPLRDQMNRVLQAGLQEAGYQVSSDPHNSVEFQIEKLLTNVDEGVFGFTAKTEIIINAVANKQRDIITGASTKTERKTLNKRFRIKAMLKKPLSPDFATLELEINKQLAILTQEIITDPELNQFIQG
ncbi:YajG family lipoprotein [Shewanella surugensis]|uniref:YajG family lipoprotein n=1 Tax=Shewanella surugensis TaxID=212020 RepID=A0ABT0LCC0_9GAMM|nr:YajG family lipoprotein [Shewanella surugensis]MCL1125300.1 YajG family lipoprotein [Shewanella surugensis]